MKVYKISGLDVPAPDEHYLSFPISRYVVAGSVRGAVKVVTLEFREIQKVELLGDVTLPRQPTVAMVGDDGPEAVIPAYGLERWTEESRKVVQRALREALQLGHNYVRTEHILLALIRDEEGVAGRVLRGDLGIDVRQTVIGRLVAEHESGPR